MLNVSGGGRDDISKRREREEKAIKLQSTIPSLIANHFSSFSVGRFSQNKHVSDVEDIEDYEKKNPSSLFLFDMNIKTEDMHTQNLW